MTWVADPNHLRAEFAAKHLGIFTVRGIFRRLEVTVSMADADPTRWSVQATIDVASLDSNNEIRDRKLKSSTYLDADRFPSMSFSSTRVEPADNGFHTVWGELTLHGITREVCLRAQLNGEVPDSRGRRCRGFSGTTVLRLSDFGIHADDAQPDDDPKPDDDEVRVSIEMKAIDRQPGDVGGPPLRRRGATAANE